MDFRDPQTTLTLLDELEACGLTQPRFWQLHHTDNAASIGRHRSYCQDILSGATKKFNAGKENEHTAVRLSVCLQQLKAGEPWDSAIARALVVMPFSGVRGFLPTAHDEQLEAAVAELATRVPPTEPPIGQAVPQVVEMGPGKRFVRDPYVRDWVERRAAGRCEHCLEPAPFVRTDGRAFLEVHHVVRLADGGSDRHTNTVALCPNCHRLLHHSSNASQAADRLYTNVPQLRREVPNAKEA